jgi:hypothetical protein
VHTFRYIAHLNPSNDRLLANDLYRTAEQEPWTAADVRRFHEQRQKEAEAMNVTHTQQLFGSLGLTALTAHQAGACEDDLAKVVPQEVLKQV